jgi:hypothetical protein
MSDEHSNDSRRTDPTRALEVGPDPTRSGPHGAETTPVAQGDTTWVTPPQDAPQDVPRQTPPGASAVPAPGALAVATAPVTRARGPHAASMVLGLLCLLVAGLVIAREVNGFRVDWAVFGPGAIVGIGVLVLVLGVLGLARRER